VIRGKWVRNRTGSFWLQEKGGRVPSKQKRECSRDALAWSGGSSVAHTLIDAGNRLIILGQFLTHFGWSRQVMRPIIFPG